MEPYRNVICERRTYTNHPDTHDHPFAQLLFPLEGSMEIKTEIQSMELDERGVFLIPGYCMHTYYSRITNEFLVIDIPDHFLEQTNAPQQGMYFPMTEYWKAIRFLLLEETHTEQPQSATIHHLIQIGRASC